MKAASVIMMVGSVLALFAMGALGGSPDLVMSWTTVFVGGIIVLSLQQIRAELIKARQPVEFKINPELHRKPRFSKMN